MTKYTFDLKNNNNFTTNTCPFYNKCKKSIDYSKVLDDLIAADIKEKNPWLYGTNTITTDSNNTIKIKLTGINTINDDLENAFLFGDKYKTYYTFDDAYKFFTNLAYGPFEKNKEYKLSNGDIIEITDDYIHINEKMYFFNLMDNNFFYNLSKKLKKTIATIYVDGLKITIKK
jgi:hypothetical protein